MKSYIKMNEGNYLSLGNLFKIIKDISINSNNTVQKELFCTIMEIDDIKSSTVNNYCLGCRKIGNIYKQKYLNMKKKYLKDKTIFYSIVLNLINLIDGINHYPNNILEFINNHESFILLTNNLYNLAKNDHNISIHLLNEINELINKNNYYESFINMLFYLILENKQPLYPIDNINKTINHLLKDTNLSINDLEDILSLELKEGLSYVRKLKLLAEKNNPYALYKLALMEYRGQITGQKRIDVCLNYLNKSANMLHPASNWLIANIYLEENNKDIDTIFKYLLKAKELGSIASLNTLGICYLKGNNIEHKKDEKKALEYFLEAIKDNYVYSYNNLGMYYEKKKDYQKAIYYYEESAKEEESWALNKLGEIYRLGIYTKKDEKKAFDYYQKASLASNYERCHYANYNLAKYYYLEGNINLLINKDINKAKELFIKEKDYLIEANIELLYLYIKENNKEKIRETINIIENNPKYNNEIKLLIENKIKEIKNFNHINID